MEKAMTVVIVIIVCLATGIALLVMTGDTLDNFFDIFDTDSDETIETVDCNAKCFDCCMRNPSKTNPGKCGDPDLQIDCNYVC